MAFPTVLSTKARLTYPVSHGLLQAAVDTEPRKLKYLIVLQFLVLVL